MKHKLIAALERYLEGLTVTQGAGAGSALALMPWQRRFLRGTFSQPGDGKLSIARGAGKSAFTSAIACAALDGPLMEPRGEVLIVASSFDQALINFRHVKGFMAPKLESEPRRWRIQDSANRATIEDRQTGALLRVLGSDPRRLHGAAPKLLLLDEVAQWPDPERMLAALLTSTGKIADSRALWLGTRPASDTHPFAVALADGTGYTQVHAARPDDPLFRKATWTRANPSLPHMPDLLAAVRREAERAKINENACASFKALRLNQGTADVVESLLLDAGTWTRIEGHEAEAVGSYVLGIDLGSGAAMSAAAAFFPETGRLDCFAVFPELPPLDQRGLMDNVAGLYTRMLGRGELIQAGERVADVHRLLTEALERWGRPTVITSDRWRERELRQALEAVSFPLHRAGPAWAGLQGRRGRHEGVSSGLS